MARYVAAIKDKVEGNWIRPPGTSNISCKVKVKQLPGGQITNVQLLGSCGSTVVDRSVKQAIYKSDPLPTPSSDNLFQPEIEFTFRPDQ